MHYRSLKSGILIAAFLCAIAPAMPSILIHVPKSLAQGETMRNRRADAERLLRQGKQQYDNSQFQEALESFQASLEIYREIGDRDREGTVLNNIGAVYRSLGDHAQALEYYQQALAIGRELRDPNRESITLQNIGAAYMAMGRYSDAVEALHKSLALMRGIDNPSGEAAVLNNLGETYRNLGKYRDALTFLQQSLEIRRSLGERAEEGVTLNNFGTVYDSLGEYQEALNYYQKALEIFREVGDLVGEVAALNNMGEVYRILKQYEAALAAYDQALEIARKISTRAEEGIILANIGEVYSKLERYAQALEYYEEALIIHREVGDRNSEGINLKRQGSVLRSLNLFSQALDRYHQALISAREVGNVAAEGTILADIAQVFALQNEVELSIVFYKASVNVREEIRAGIQVLPLKFQLSFTNLVADDYRALADLLLQQDRVIEAQQVLDLLKVQELQDYLGDLRGNEATDREIESLDDEEKIYNLYDQAISEGQELARLYAIPEEELSEEQRNRRSELIAKEQEITKTFNNFIELPEVREALERLDKVDQRRNLDLRSLNRLQRDLRDLGELQQNAVLLYPLILEDRLELVLVTPYTPPIHRPVAISREELNQEILMFREALKKRDNNIKDIAQKLYQWLIQPIEKDLEAVEVESGVKTTIIYAPDGALRYIPLAALYDGEHWLTERFQINHITALSISDLDTPPNSELRVLAAAFSEGEYSIKAGDSSFEFTGLQFAGVEVENLSNSLTETTLLVNQSFTKEEIVPRTRNHTIVHLATHAAFVVGQPEDSFILFGDGSFVTLRDIRSWNLNNVDLFVLSACETGVNGWGNGEEILGFGYQVESAGARASIASLWSVDDGGTQILMNAFYENLQNGSTKAEALRQAQITLIQENSSTLLGQRGIGIGVRDTELQRRVRTNSSFYTHPYYWAPFILIGNGL